MKIAIRNIRTGMSISFSTGSSLISASGLEPVQANINVTELVGKPGGIFNSYHVGSRHISLVVDGKDPNRVQGLCRIFQPGWPCLVTITYHDPFVSSNSTTSTAIISGYMQAPTFSQFEDKLKVLLVIECPESDFDAGRSASNRGAVQNALLRFPAMRSDYAYPLVKLEIPQTYRGGQLVKYTKVRIWSSITDDFCEISDANGFNASANVTLEFNLIPDEFQVVKWTGWGSSATNPVILTPATGSGPVPIYYAADRKLNITLTNNQSYTETINYDYELQSYVHAVIDDGKTE